MIWLWFGQVKFGKYIVLFLGNSFFIKVNASLTAPVPETVCALAMLDLLAFTKSYP